MLRIVTTDGSPAVVIPKIGIVMTPVSCRVCESEIADERIEHSYCPHCRRFVCEDCLTMHAIDCAGE